MVNTYLKKLIMGGWDVDLEVKAVQNIFDNNYATRANLLDTADMFMFVYSISSRDSFGDICQQALEVRKTWPAADSPVMIVSCRKIGIHRQEVSPSDGRRFAETHDCMFSDVSEANTNAVHGVFLQLTQTKLDFIKRKQTREKRILSVRG